MATMTEVPPASEGEAIAPKLFYLQQWMYYLLKVGTINHTKYYFKCERGNRDSKEQLWTQNNKRLALENN